MEENDPMSTVTEPSRGGGMKLSMASVRYVDPLKDKLGSTLDRLAEKHAQAAGRDVVMPSDVEAVLSEAFGQIIVKR